VSEKRRREIEQLEVAKRQVAQRYGWTRVEGASAREFYAKDEAGHLLWLKARTENSGSMSWDGLHTHRHYDYLIGILVSPNGVVSTVMRAPKETVELLKRNRDTKNPRLRWNDAKEDVDMLC
jgi:hypothetical protein